MSSADAISLLRDLSKIILDGIDNIEATCNKSNLKFPSPDEPFTPASHAPHLNHQIIEAAATITSAAAQITSIVRPAPISATFAALQFNVPAALRVALVTNTPEILREAGPQGLHVNEIAAKSRTDPGKLGRILRLLATEHIFKEVAPDVFANNRISSVMDTYKSADDLYANPQDKHVGTSGIPALLTHFTDEVLKFSAFFAEAVTEPEYAMSGEPTDTAMSIAFNIKLGFFPWLELPENKDRLRRFGIAMEGTRNTFNPRAILEGFDWKGIPNGVVVDVGGGIGSQSLIAAQEYPDINFVVQDRPAVIEDAKKFWAESMPEAVSSGRVTLQPNDFFKSQPVKGADVYYMRGVLHDWSDTYALEILQQITDAAGPNSKLLIADIIMSYACEDTTVARNIPGGTGSVPPKPLLPNWGHATVCSNMIDTQMTIVLNGMDRTLAQLDNLLHKAGWKVERVYRGPDLSSILQQVLAVRL